MKNSHKEKTYDDGDVASSSGVISPTTPLFNCTNSYPENKSIRNSVAFTREEKINIMKNN